MLTVKGKCLSVKDGMTSGFLTVVGEPFKNPIDKKYWVICKCICGNVSKYRVNFLTCKKATKSCGCLMLDGSPRRFKYIDGRTRLAAIHKGMMGRCHSESHSDYPNYGGRGITVYEGWRDNFEAFRTWAIQSGYADNLQLDRRDNNKGYSPDNCRWVTSKTNNRNRRDNHYATAFGETKMIMEWSEDPRCKTTYKNLHQRIVKLKWDAEKAITTPSQSLLWRKGRGLRLNAV